MFYVYHPDLTVTEIDHLEEIRKELRVDEQTGFQQLVDAMLAGKPILPKSP
jgi:predicted nucleic acid-binding protein